MPRATPSKPPLRTEADTPTHAHRVVVEGWLPTRLNVLITSHPMVAHRKKQSDKRAVAVAVRFAGLPLAGVPDAERKQRRKIGLDRTLPGDPTPVRRRVRLELTLPKRTRTGDSDGWFKSVLDALVACGALFDDSHQWCEPVMPPTYVRGGEGERRTVIVLEDL